MNMNAVGIDVSKGKSMVAILRPYGEIVSSPFEIKHTSSNIQSSDCSRSDQSKVNHASLWNILAVTTNHWLVSFLWQVFL